MIERQVCSLELAKRLKESGVKQDSLFAYISDTELEFLPTEIRNCNVCVAAFTAAELGEMLPHNLPGCYLQAVKNHKNNWLVSYVISDSLPPIIAIIEETEANARAKMLIHLIENNLWKPI